MGGTANYPESEKTMVPSINEFKSTEELGQAHTNTPTLDAFLHRPAMQNKMQDVATSFHGFDAATWQESARPIIHSLYGLVLEAKKEKQAGRVSKEEKKAMKAELKTVAKEFKLDAREMKRTVKVAA